MDRDKRQEALTRMTCRTITVFFLLSLVLTGCWDRQELNDLALVMGTGIDQSDDGQVKLSVQIFIPRSAASGGSTDVQGGGGGGGGGAGGQTTVRVAEGQSMAQAVSKLQSQLSRTLFWGHDEVYIFGARRAAAGIEKDLDFILRARQPRERANVYISQGEAIDTLRLIPRLERDSAETLREMNNMHDGLDVTVFDLLKMLDSTGGTAPVPYIVKIPPEPDVPLNYTVSHVVGTALIKKGKLQGILKEDSNEGLLWLRNQNKGGVIFTFQPDGGGGEVSIRIVRSHVKAVPAIHSGVWSVQFRIVVDGNLFQNTNGGNVLRPSWVQRMERSAANSIEELTMETVRLSQHQYKSDVLGLGELFRRHYPRAWRRNKEKWDFIYPQIEVHVKVQVNIRRPGITNENIPY